MKILQKRFIGVLLFIPLLLTGCNSFHISEEELNQDIAKRLAKPQNNQIDLTLEGNTLNLDLLVISADIQLTERDGGLVLVDLVSDMTGQLTAFGQSFSITTQLKPSFESGVRLEENRVYLVAPKITSIDIEGSNFNEQILRSTLGSLHDDFEKALVQYFDENPVYVLDHSPFEKSTASLVKSIIITEGALEFSIF